MLKHCAKWLIAEFAVVHFCPVTAQKQSSPRQIKTSISITDCEVPQIIMILKFFFANQGTLLMEL